MKVWMKRTLLLLLVLCMLVCMAACAKPKASENDRNGDTGTQNGEEQLPFGKTDYDKDLNIYYINWGLYPEFFFSEDLSTTMGEAIHKRNERVSSYLGVNVVGHLGGNDESVLRTMETQIMSGLDDYQIYLTHCFLSLTALVTQGYLTDFGDIDQIDLDRSYWNKSLMSDLKIHGSLYFGSNDYMLHDPNVIFFNKDVLNLYSTLENPYELVRRGEWTMEKMFAMAAETDSASEGGTGEKIYGITGEAEWQVLAFADSCDAGGLVNNDGYMTLNYGPSNERYSAVFEMLDMASDASWFGLYGKSSGQMLTMANCKTLFSYESLQQAYKYRSDDSDVRFGLLPYPKYNKAQTDYRSFDWSGFIVVPISAQDTEMIGKSMEALAFFSSETTIPAYYEKLLGTRIANSPDDAEMLNIVWDGIVSNPAFNFSYNPGGGTNGLFKLVYGMQSMLYAKLQKTDPVPNVSGLWEANKISAQNFINNYLND